VHNVVDGVEFLSMLCLFEIVGAQSVEEESDCCVFVLRGMVGSVRNYRVSEGGFSVNGGSRAVGGSVDGDIQVVYGVVYFSFGCEL
jgi:hypothetical protein